MKRLERMLDEVNKFIERIKNYKMLRTTEHKSQYELEKEWHKRRINECYGYLKYLSLRKDRLSLSAEYRAVSDLTNEVLQTYVKWRDNVSKTDKLDISTSGTGSN